MVGGRPKVMLLLFACRRSGKRQVGPPRRGKLVADLLGIGADGQCHVRHSPAGGRVLVWPRHPGLRARSILIPLLILLTLAKATYNI